MTTLRPNWPAGLPTPQALQIATDAVGRHFARPETASHPVVVSQAIELAYLLTAFDLVPDETAGKLPSTRRDRVGGIDQYRAVAPAADMA